MAAEKYSASMDDELLEQARAAAEREGVSLSSWLAGAAAHQLRLRALEEMIEEWEAQHGAITAEELEAVERKIGAARRATSSRSTPRTQTV